MCGLQLMAVSCWFYCTEEKNKAINSRIEQKYKEPDERSTKPNQTNLWCAISMHVWEKKPFETSSSLKKSPLSILLTKDLHIIEKQIRPQ